MAIRSLILIVFLGVVSKIGYTQVSTEVTEKNNVYNKKGDYYFDKNEFKKAILFYTLAYQKDTSDYFSILQRAEAYTKLKLYPQAEFCYRAVFDRNLTVNNVYKLKYALVLLKNGKTNEFKYWLNQYNAVVNNEVKGQNYLVSSNQRLKLYKDTAIVLRSASGKVDSFKFKIKYAGYQYRRKSSGSNEIYMILSNGDEYSIAASPARDYKFSFQPMEDYHIIIQRQDIKAEDILSNKRLTPKQREQDFLNPPPIQSDSLLLQKNMKYEFSSGKYKIPPQYLNSLKQLASKYQKSNGNAVDLTALVKQLQLEDGNIYTLKFTRVINPKAVYQKALSTVTMNEKDINIYGQSFVLLLPDRENENFTLQTNIEQLKKKFNPKDHSLVIDDSPLFKPEKQGNKEIIPLTVNTKKVNEVMPPNRLSGKEISIIPGTEYILTLSKPNPKTGKNQEVFVPLTRGVKYNLSPSKGSNSAYKEELADFLTGRKNLQLANEEVIDISVLSKEIDVKPGENVSFTLLPVKHFGKQPANAEQAKSELIVDGKTFEIDHNEKYSINIPFNINNKINFQTDLSYLKKNFKPNDYTVKLDTTSFLSGITVDTNGYGSHRASGWLSVSVNTDSIQEVKKQDQFTAREVSVIPGKEYILTVSKIDGKTGKKDEIYVPLIRNIKYDFTTNPGAQEAYKKSLKAFTQGRKKLKTSEGTKIDITMISKELQIKPGDKVSFSLLPVKKIPGQKTVGGSEKSSLFLDNKVVEFTYIQKYSVKMPLSNEHKVNMHTDLEHIKKNFNPNSINLDFDTTSFFSEITVDTTGYGYMAVQNQNKIKDPVYDMVVINFDVNAYELKPAARDTIRKKVIDALKKDSRLYVTIKGYTDPIGDAHYNLILSKKRAESVKDFLKNNGVGDNRIRTFSYGESQSLKAGVNWKNMSEAQLKKYRKVEITIYLPKKKK